MKRILPLSSTHTHHRKYSDFDERRRLCANGGVFFLWGKILLCSTTGQSFGKIVRRRRRALSSSCIVFFRVHQKRRRRRRRRRVLRRVLHRILLVDHFSSPPSSGCTRPSSRIYSRSFRQYAETRNIRTKLDSISLRSRTAGTNQ